MKHIILLSTFVLSQTLLASTLSIYSSGITLIEEHIDYKLIKNETTFTYNDVPKSILFDSLYSQLPKDTALTSLSCKKEKHKQKAQLNFELNSHANHSGEIKLHYLAKNISYTTDYILHLNDSNAKLSGWINLQNNSGKDFIQSNVRLLGGDINRAENFSTHRLYQTKTSLNAEQLPKHQAVQNYHLYTLPQKITLNSGETKRIKFFDEESVNLKNRYTARLYNPLYLMGERSSKVYREIELQKLKKALLKGKFRIYTQVDDTPLLLGESYISNSAENETLKLKVGTDFDTKVVQKVLSRDDTKSHLNASIEYRLINHSHDEKTITLEIPFNKNKTSSIKSEQKYRFTKGNLATFTLKVPAQSQRSFEVNFTTQR